MGEDYGRGVYAARLQHLPHCHGACLPPCPILAVYEALEEEHRRTHPDPVMWQPGLGPNICPACLALNNPRAMEDPRRDITPRERRKLERRRRSLMEQAENIERRQTFSSDFFRGHVKGPRIRVELAAELKTVREELEATERALGMEVPASRF